MSAPNTSLDTGSTLPFTGSIFTLPVMVLGLVLTMAGLVPTALRRLRGSQS